MQLSGLDIVFLVIIAFAALRAMIRGFVREFMSVAALLLGIAAAVLFSGVAAEYLQPWLGVGPWAQVVAFLALFVVVYIVVKIFENALDRVVEHIHAESLDRAVGFFLGIAEGILLTFIIILLLQLQPFFEAQGVLRQSIFARTLTPLLPYVERLIRGGA